MTSKLNKMVNNFRLLLRYITIGTFPAAMLLSVPFPTTSTSRRWYSHVTIAPAIGVIFLFISLVLAVVDTKLAKKFKDRIGSTEYEYHIVLPTAQKDKDAHRRRKLWILFTLFTDFGLLITYAIILGFTMSELNSGIATMLIVYAALPYYFAAVSHLLLLCLGLIQLGLSGLKRPKKPLECPHCHHLILDSPGSESPHEHSPKMSVAVAQHHDQETGVTDPSTEV